MNLARPEYTAGPWNIQRTITGGDYAIEFAGEKGDYERKYNVFVESPQQVIAGVGGIGKANCLANAHLIAAAPALLSACQAAVEDITRAGLQHTLPLTVQLIRQAIALATGNESGKE